MVSGTVWSLLPPIIAIALALITKEVYLSLFCGIAIGAFTNEEGVRYAPDMMGSLVYAGGMSAEDACATIGIDGTVLGEELKRIGYGGTVEPGFLKPYAFVELHIEQGPILEAEGYQIGAVENLQGISWQQITVEGAQNHAGTTPIAYRHDAGVAAAKVITFMRERCLASGGKIGNRDESGYNIAWCTGLAPYTGLENCEYMYVVEGGGNPAGARLFIRYITGGADGKSGGLKPFQKEGNWAVRDDISSDWNPASLDECGAIEGDLENIYNIYLDTQDMWTYWLAKNPNM